jgi:phosphate transport system permease protein
VWTSPLGAEAGGRAVPVAGLGEHRVTSAARVEDARWVLGTSDGRAIPFEMEFEVSYPEGRRIVTPRPRFGEAGVLDGARRPILRLAAATPETGPLVAAQLGPRALVVQSVVERRALIGPSRREVSLRPLTLEIEGEASALAVDRRGEDLFVGTSRGQIVRYTLRAAGEATRVETVEAAGTPGTAITALGFALGDRTLVLGDAAGGVATWQLAAPPTGGDPRLVRVHRFRDHREAVTAVSASRRDKGFVTGGASGEVLLHHATTGRTLLALEAPGGAVQAVVLAPKADGVLAADPRGAVEHWRVENPHPEASLEALFGRVWYEGYAEPAWVWQSTGGTDDFEPKLSLTPLLFGTLKGTFYALLFAVPLAILAAVYVSEFMHPRVKGLVKPVVEIMAALPSVVLGFLAGLWLAPRLERVVPGLFLLPLVTAVAILGAYALWQTLPRAVRGRLRPGTEVVLLVPVVVGAGWAAFALGAAVERLLLGGDYRGWLLGTLGLTYDQRNALVVGIAMGFAVVPIIFTIAEDSLANVPQHLRAGSLALGATRWQTALRVVLPTASPGIFSAVMIGFGRAVGETMIVLMATGNTPIMEASIFNGFRALSANIAVELPEAPDGGTLFRVLFLSAFLLFCLTFLVNTAAELVRLRLRRKFRYL